MDDIDEGIGSNSSSCNEIAVDSLKPLNGMCITDNHKNIEHSTMEDKNDDTLEENDTSSYEESNSEKCSMAEITKSIANDNSTDSRSIDDVSENSNSAVEAFDTENLKNNSEQESKHKLDKLSPSHSPANILENGNNGDLIDESTLESKEDETYKNVSSKCSEDNQISVSDSETKIEGSNNDQDDTETIPDTVSTPLKDESDGNKPCFALDGARKTLTSLVAKAKSIEKPKEENEVDSVEEGKKEEVVSESLSDNQKNETDAEMADPDDDLLAYDNDEGISMVIGSDNEDELLNLTSPEQENVSECNENGKILENNDSDTQTYGNSDKDIATDSVTDRYSSDTKENTSQYETVSSTEEISQDTVDSPPDIQLDSDSQDSAQSVNCEAKTENQTLEKEENEAVKEENTNTTEVNSQDMSENEDVLILKDSHNSHSEFEQNESHQTQSKLSDKTEHDVGLSTENVNGDMDEDDDVIFEGITKSDPEVNEKDTEESTNKMETDAANPNENEQLVSDTALEASEEKQPMENEEDEDDDDVILEKVVEPENNQSKQNCDKSNSIENKLDCNSKTVSTEKTQEHSKPEPGPSVSEQPVRKRPAESESLASSAQLSKRSKLDMNGITVKDGKSDEPESIELIDSDGETPTEKEQVISNVVNDTSKETVVCSPHAKIFKEEKYVTITEKELDRLVRSKVKAYLASQQETLVAKLQQKIKDLQQNNDLWKRQVKDLQVKVNDVTVLQQKLEKRKAATAALRQITTRTVAVQVEDGKTAGSGRAIKTAVNSTPPKNAPPSPLGRAPTAGTGTIRLPMQQPSTFKPGDALMPATAQFITVTTSFSTNTVKTMLDASRNSQATPNTGTMLLSYQPSFITQPNKTQTVSLPQVAVTQNNASKSVVTKPSPKSKVIDLTEDDDGSKMQAVSGTLAVGSQGVRHVLAAQPGTQLVRGAVPSQGSYQLMFNAPGLAVASVGTTGTTVVPSTLTLQNSSQQTSFLLNQSASNISPGTSLARAAVPLNPSPNAQAPKVLSQKSGHPAPFPAIPPYNNNKNWKEIPPKPTLRISRGCQGIVLSWNMAYSADTHATISSYHLFAYQETSAAPLSTLWKKVGEVKALPLPMACTLTQFQVGNKYHFAVRAQDVHNRVGHFSDPGTIHLSAVSKVS